MILAAIAVVFNSDAESSGAFAVRAQKLADKLDLALSPENAERCWGRGVGFTLAMQHAVRIVNEA